MGHTGHQPGDFRLHPIHLGFGHLEHQFVVHLHDHLRALALRVQRLLHRHHAHLDEVGGGTLHGGVDGGTLGPGAARAVGTVDLGQVEPPAEHRFHIASRLGLGLGVVHVVAHPREALEVAVDVVLGRRVVDAQRLRQAIAAHAVDEPEVDDLGVAALLAADQLRRQAEHFRCRGAVHVHPLGKGLEEGLVATEVGHDAQLDLRIVGTGNHVPWWCDEGLAHTPPLGRADRDVLQVGVVAGQAPRHRHRLRIVRVHAAGAGVGHAGQLVGVGALELGERAVFEDLGRQRVVLGQLFQHFFIGAAGAGGGFFHHRQAQLVEKDLAQLLGAAEVERLSGNRVGLLLQLQDALAQFVALPGQGVGVDHHTVAFDAVQRLAAGDFQFVDGLELVVGLQAGPQHPMHVQRLVAVFTGVFGSFVDGHLGKGDLVGTLATQVFVADAAAPHMPLGQAGEVVGLVHLQHIALQHGVVGIALHLDAVIGKHMPVVFDVLPQFEVPRALQPGFEAGQHLVAGELRWGVRAVMGQGNVGGLPWLYAE